jgi:hypothetical protein
MLEGIPYTLSGLDISSEFSLQYLAWSDLNVLLGTRASPTHPPTTFIALKKYSRTYL